MLKKIKNIILYGDTDRASYANVRGKIEAANRVSTLLFASVATLLIATMFCLSYFLDGLADSRPVYFFGALLSLALVAVSLASKRFPVLTYAGVYMAISIFLLYGIAIATLTRPEEQTVTFMVMLIFVPLIFVDRPIRMAASLIFYIILFILMAYRTKTGSILSVDVTDAIIFGFLSLVSETIVYRTKIRSYVLENKLHILSETDQLTGLNNRNSYEWKLETYPSLYQRSICCVYIDVNGLHERNNTEGHKSGDEMLQYIADVVIQLFGRDHSYRIGGDEYVTFVLDDTRAHIADRIEKMNGLIRAQGFHVAVGLAYQETKNANIQRLIADAEAEMYRDKAAYYKENDRRAR